MVSVSGQNCGTHGVTKVASFTLLGSEQNCGGHGETHAASFCEQLGAQNCDEVLSVRCAVLWATSKHDLAQMATSDPIQFAHEHQTYLPDGSLDELS